MVFHRKQSKGKVHTHYNSPVVWQSHCSVSQTLILVSILTTLERRDCPTSGRDLKWTLQVDIKKKKGLSYAMSSVP